MTAVSGGAHKGVCVSWLGIVLAVSLLWDWVLFFTFAFDYPFVVPRGTFDLRIHWRGLCSECAHPPAHYQHRIPSFFQPSTFADDVCLQI